MIILDGKKTATTYNEVLKEKITKLKNTPHLSIVLVGDDPASAVYVRNKLKSATQLGIETSLHQLTDTASQAEVSNLIKKLNQDQKVDGILLQLPLPKHLDEEELTNLIDDQKDVDGFHILNQGRLFKKLPTIKPATPQGIMMLLEAYKIDVSGLNALIIGRSSIVGAPIAKMLLDANATVTIAHSRTKNIKSLAQQADLIVVAIGKDKFLTAEMVKDGVIVVDVGINRVDGKLVGDVDYDQVCQKASYITPVPGGVGPMTICALGFNLVEIIERKGK
jgi:methylenetetrahydrofolate dehydrogenase (NADP+)/methenyltetrahydrofolate cyclohydrolase